MRLWAGNEHGSETTTSPLAEMSEAGRCKMPRVRANATHPAQGADFLLEQLDSVLDMIVGEHNLTLGFELMGNPRQDSDSDQNLTRHPHPATPRHLPALRNRGSPNSMLRLPILLDLLAALRQPETHAGNSQAATGSSG